MPIGKNSKAEALYHIFCERINHLENGTPFPSVRNLMKEYSVSQLVVVSAIRKLKEKGVLKSVVGSGTVVCRELKHEVPHFLYLRNNWKGAGASFQENLFRKAADKYNCEIRIECYDYREDICAHLDRYQADVIFLGGIPNDQLTPRQVMALSQSVVPVIVIQNAIPVDNIRYVCGNDMLGGALAARYLAEMGHRKIGLLFCEPHLRTTTVREQNFSFAAQSLECSVVMLDCGLRPGEKPTAEINRFIREYAEGKYDFTALFCISDYGAQKAMEALESYHIRVPEDLSILGYGAVPVGRKVTSIDFSREAVVQQSVIMAKSLVRGDISVNMQIDIDPVLNEKGTVLNIKNKWNRKKFLDVHSFAGIVE